MTPSPAQLTRARLPIPRYCEICYVAVHIAHQEVPLICARNPPLIHVFTLDVELSRGTDLKIHLHDDPSSSRSGRSRDNRSGTARDVQLQRIRLLRMSKRESLPPARFRFRFRPDALVHRELHLSDARPHYFDRPPNVVDLQRPAVPPQPDRKRLLDFSCYAPSTSARRYRFLRGQRLPGPESASRSGSSRPHHVHLRFLNVHFHVRRRPYPRPALIHLTEQQEAFSCCAEPAACFSGT